jgi:hypothetical protein
MKEAIRKQNLSDEFYAPEKCYITELSNRPDDPDASIARARVEPGVTTRWHRLAETVERYYISSLVRPTAQNKLLGKLEASIKP